MLRKSLKEKGRLSVFISLVLRHKPEAAFIELDEQGFADVEKLIEGINKSGRTIDHNTLIEIVKEDSKGRYSFSPDGKKIRANQGHSVDVDVSLRSAKPQAVLYHGTAQENLAKIAKTGIQKMNRNFVHLSYDEKIAESVGKRHGTPIVLQVDTCKMIEDGYDFLISENGVWQIEHVPSEYILNIPESITTLRENSPEENFKEILEEFKDAKVETPFTIHAKDPQATIERLKNLMNSENKK